MTGTAKRMEKAADRTKEKRKHFLREHAPCYIYDRKTIAQNCETLKTALPGTEFLYSVKANPHQSVVNEIGRHGFGADAASPGEVEIALMAGIPADRIFYSAPGKTARDIRQAFGKCHLIADSFHELELIEREAALRGETAETGIRINPDFGMFGGSGTASQFGIDEDQFGVLPEKLRYLPHVKITGIHVHDRSQVLFAGVITHYWKQCYELARRVSALDGMDVRFINFGSGIGTIYDPREDAPVNMNELTRGMEEIRQANESGLKAGLLVETGRFPVLNAGTYYTEIVDIKVSHGKKYLIVNGGLNGFARPGIAHLLHEAGGGYPDRGMEPLYTSAGECAFDILTDAQEKETVTIAGNLCTSTDILAEDIELPKAEPGDILVVSNAGSYAASLSFQAFSSHRKPGEYLV